MWWTVLPVITRTGYGETKWHTKNGKGPEKEKKWNYSWETTCSTFWQFQVIRHVQNRKEITTHQYIIYYCNIILFGILSTNLITLYIYKTLPALLSIHIFIVSLDIVNQWLVFILIANVNIRVLLHVTPFFRRNIIFKQKVAKTFSFLSSIAFFSLVICNT